MRKIFFNDRFIAICDSSEVPETVDKSNVCTLSEFAELQALMTNFLYQSSETEFYICYKNADDAFFAFCELFKVIFTGGGFVRNSRGDVLMIYRFEHWDLPKGRQEIGENIKITAVREVQEECGVCNIKIGDFLTETYHCYHENGHWIMKRTFWYEMFCDEKKLTPQTAEDIEKVEFVPKEKLNDYIKKTYASIREVFSIVISREL